MELTPIYRSVVALDVHQAKLTVCALFEDEQGELQVELKEFGGFKRDRQAMAEWAASFASQTVVMKSTGIYWKSPYAALEGVGIQALVVNAYHVKQVPGRKTDIADAQWLAILARRGGKREKKGPKLASRIAQRAVYTSYTHARKSYACSFF